MQRIRAAARTYGMSIRTGRVARGSDTRTYSVIDTATGQTLRSNVPTLDELSVQVWWIIRQRRRSDQPGESGAAAREACPRCGTLRVGSFRYCRACGMDFEPARPTEPDLTVSTPAPSAGEAADRAWSAVAPATEERPIVERPVVERPILGRLPGPVGEATTVRTGVGSTTEYPVDTSEVRRAIAPHTGTAQRIVRATKPTGLYLREASSRRRFASVEPDPEIPQARRRSRFRTVLKLVVTVSVGLLIVAFVWVVQGASRV
jgi:hypothetical protein